MNTRNPLVACLLLLFVHPVSASQTAITCIGEVALEGVVRKMQLALETREHLGTPLIMLPGRRAAVGTSVQKEGDTIVVGGRLLVHDIEKDEPIVSLETPTLAGKPTRMGEITASRDGRFLAATGGHFFGGPVLMYGLDPTVGFLHSVQPFRASAVDMILDIFADAAEGNGPAKRKLVTIDPDGDLLKLFKTDRDFLRNSLLASLGQRANAAPEPIPAMGVDFHPSGSTYLINAGYVTIRDTKTGNEIRRFSLQGDGSPHTLDPPLKYFLGKGEMIAGLSQQYLMIWEAKSGKFLDAQRHEAALGYSSRILQLAPDRSTLAFSVKNEKGFGRQIWTTTPSGRGAKLKVLAETYSPKGVEHLPAGALADDQAYAFEGSHGTVDLFRDGKKELTLSIGTGDSKTVREIVLTKDAGWLAATGMDDKGDFLEVWTVKANPKGVRIRLPKPAAGYGQGITDLSFSLDGGWLGYQLTNYKKGEGDQASDWKSEPYVVDIYKLLASSIQK